jgi:exodeoxyribonuclease VII large subunit
MSSHRPTKAGSVEKQTLFELNEFIRRVLALNLPDPLWVSCEIAEVNLSRGHYYLSLVQKNAESDEIVAKADAVLWQRQARQLRHKLGSDFDALLRSGMAVLIYASVDFHERYGLKLSIQDLDPAYTLGQLEARRRQIFARLQAEGLPGKNRQHPLPAVLQRIALISSEQAAGRQDFLQHLAENPYGYRFDCRLFPAAVQGEQAAIETVQQLRRIARHAERFDAVAIIRGGGARLDLAAYDHYELCKAAAEMPLPVLSGIGHEVDEVLLDLMAHTALKTPTAVADFLIEHNARFEAGLLQLGQHLSLLANQATRQQALRLERLEQDLRYLPRLHLQQQGQQLERLAADVPRACRLRTQAEHQALAQFEQIIALLEPEATLRRGFSIAYRDGQAVASATHISPGQRFRLRFRDGEIAAEGI